MQLREWHKVSMLSKYTMHEFSSRTSAYKASYRGGTPARSHGDRTSLDKSSGDACLKGILVIVFLSKSVMFVVQIFDKAQYVYFVDTLYLYKFKILSYYCYYYYYYYYWLQLGYQPVAVFILHVNKYEKSN